MLMCLALFVILIIIYSLIRATKDCDPSENFYHDKNMVRKVYISGPITGTDDYMERFAAAEKDLTALGCLVINPAKVNAQLPKETTWEEYMQMSFTMLDMCDVIYLLPGWQSSKGAKLEVKRARNKGMRIELLFENEKK